MRPMRLGLLAALIVAVMAPAMAHAAAAPSVSSEARKQGMADAPALVAAAGVTCQVSDARLAGKTAADKKTGSPGASVYEVACGPNSLGFLIQTNGTNAPQVFSCIGSNYPADMSKPTSPCILPANIDLVPAIDALAAKSNAPCAPTKIRAIGQTSTNTLFEVACADGHDFVMSGSVPLDATKPATIVNCLQTETSASAKCMFTDSAARLAAEDALAKLSDPGCVVKDRRYIGPLADGTDGYEFACQSGKGFIAKISSKGTLAETLDCAKLAGGGCTLTDTRAATAEQAGLYTKLAKNAGSNCTVSRYAVFPAQGDKETVELVCSDGNGAIGIFPATGKGTVLDCGHALIAGYKCTLGKVDYTGLTNDLKKFDKKECTVSSTGSPLKAADGTIRLEVACSDGLPGYMIQFSDAQTPKDVTACSFAGNCVLPTNKKKG
ncbi:MAG: hypothetical protein ACXWKO_15350 [Phenylobacterium sp.]